MKKLIALIILTFMFGSILAGCAPTGENSADGGGNASSDEGGNKTEVGSEDSTGSGESQDGNGNENGGTVDPNPENPDPSDKTEPENPENPDPSDKTEPENPENPGNEPPSVTDIPVGSAVGMRFADMTLRTLDGGEINTADLRGKIIVFNMWATWCPPCKAELPDFNLIASEYSEDVVVIAVHIYDPGMYDMPSYVATNFPNTDIVFAYDVYENTAYFAAGGTGAIPQTAIIDKDGVIVYSNKGRLYHSQLITIIEENK